MSFRHPASNLSHLQYTFFHSSSSYPGSQVVFSPRGLRIFLLAFIDGDKICYSKQWAALHFNSASQIYPRNEKQETPASIPSAGSSMGLAWDGVSLSLFCLFACWEIPGWTEGNYS